MSAYRCVNCWGTLQNIANVKYICEECGGTFPIIDGIGVFLRTPQHSFLIYQQEIQACETQLDDTRKTLQSFIGQNNEDNELTARAKQTIHGYGWQP